MDPLKQTFRGKLAKVATDRIFREAQRQAELFRDHAACGSKGLKDKGFSFARQRGDAGLGHLMHAYQGDSDPFGL